MENDGNDKTRFIYRDHLRNISTVVPENFIAVQDVSNKGISMRQWHFKVMTIIFLIISTLTVIIVLTMLLIPIFSDIFSNKMSEGDTISIVDRMSYEIVSDKRRRKRDIEMESWNMTRIENAIRRIKRDSRCLNDAEHLWSEVQHFSKHDDKTHTKLKNILSKLTKLSLKCSPPALALEGAKKIVRSSSGGSSGGFYPRMAGHYPATGPESGFSSPGEAVKTSQQLSLTVPQVVQQTCVLRPNPAGPPSYACSPARPNDQAIHVPTAVSSPNPYYFPTLGGSPVFSPSTGVVHLTPPRPQAFPYPGPPQFLQPHLPQPYQHALSLHPNSHIQIHCSYHPAPNTPFQTLSFPSVQGVSEGSQRSSMQSEYNHTVHSAQKFTEGECRAGTISCGHGQRCISKGSWCDGTVDCPGATDEVSCTCKQSIDKSKICDGIFDCPNQEDELGCFGSSRH